MGLSGFVDDFVKERIHKQDFNSLTDTHLDILGFRRIGDILLFRRLFPHNKYD